MRRSWPFWRTTLFFLGLGAIIAALAPPIDGQASIFFSWHMVQHMLLTVIAAPLLLLGAPVRPLLRGLPSVMRTGVIRPLARAHTVRVLVHVVRHPLVAAALYVGGLYAWHLPYLYDAAVRHSSVHALEHLCFFTGGAVMWLPVLETLPAPEWFGTGAKLGYIAVVRAVETVLGNIFFWGGSVFYAVYAHRQRLWGISPLEDQGIAGAVLMIEGSVVTLVALAWLFLRMAGEGELRQRLLERGLDARTVKRAVRYGRAKELGGPR